MQFIDVVSLKKNILKTLPACFSDAVIKGYFLKKYVEDCSCFHQAMQIDTGADLYSYHLFKYELFQ